MMPAPMTTISACSGVGMLTLLCTPSCLKELAWLNAPGSRLTLRGVMNRFDDCRMQSVVRRDDAAGIFVVRLRVVHSFPVLIGEPAAGRVHDRVHRRRIP